MPYRSTWTWSHRYHFHLKRNCFCTHQPLWLSGSESTQFMTGSSSNIVTQSPWYSGSYGTLPRGPNPGLRHSLPCCNDTIMRTWSQLIPFWKFPRAHGSSLAQSYAALPGGKDHIQYLGDVATPGSLSSSRQDDFIETSQLQNSLCDQLRPLLHLHHSSTPPLAQSWLFHSLRVVAPKCSPQYASCTPVSISDLALWGTKHTVKCLDSVKSLRHARVFFSKEE